MRNKEDDSDQSKAHWQRTPLLLVASNTVPLTTLIFKSPFLLQHSYRKNGRDHCSACSVSPCGSIDCSGACAAPFHYGLPLRAMLFKSLFGTGQQPWVLEECLLETYSSSNCPAFFPWENVGDFPNYRLGCGTTLTRWLFCIRSRELWRLMDGFGFLSSTWERSCPSPMIIRYFVIRMKGISSSSSLTCNILVLRSVGDLPSLGLLLWSATVPENRSFL